MAPPQHYRCHVSYSVIPISLPHNPSASDGHTYSIINPRPIAEGTRTALLVSVTILGTLGVLGALALLALLGIHGSHGVLGGALRLRLNRRARERNDLLDLFHSSAGGARDESLWVVPSLCLVRCGVDADVKLELLR